MNEAPFDEVAEPVRQSFLLFLINALGIRYAFLLPAAALVAFIVVLILVLRGKGPELVGALIFIVPLPVLVGILGTVDGMLASYQVIAMSDLAPKPSEVAQGISMSLVSAWIGLMLAVPGYLLAAVGLAVRALAGQRSSAHEVIAAKIIS